MSALFLCFEIYQIPRQGPNIHFHLKKSCVAAFALTVQNYKNFFICKTFLRGIVSVHDIFYIEFLFSASLYTFLIRSRSDWGRMTVRLRLRESSSMTKSLVMRRRRVMRNSSAVSATMC